METSPSALVKLLVPKTPFILKTALFHSLWMSPTSSKWDLRTELTVNIIRSMMSGKPQGLQKMQTMTLKDSGVKGRMWISRYTSPNPADDDARQLLFRAIDDMKEGGETYTQPEYEPVYAEWTGYRADVTKDAPEPQISEAEKYESLMKEVTSDVTILYFHGGAHYLMDPASHRLPVTSKLAMLTGGRCFSVRYRLAPQNPFPAAILDAFITYLTLLYPPEGAPHKPVQAKHIIFAGDSAGGNVCFSLLQFLLHLHRTSDSIPTVNFHGKSVEVPLPGGVAGNSPWLDLTRSMPSLEKNAHYDYLPPPSDSGEDVFPHDDIWPTKPPRGDIYCDVPALCHPLVSPLSATDWSGSPPIYIGCGEEMLADENKVIASRAAKQGVPVVWEQYEAMPHCFAMMLEGLEGGKMFFASWSKFCREVVSDPGQIKTNGTFVTAKKLDRRRVNVEKLADFLPDEVVKRRMDEARDRRLKGEDHEGKDMPRL